MPPMLTETYITHVDMCAYMYVNVHRFYPLCLPLKLAACGRCSYVASWLIPQPSLAHTLALHPSDHSSLPVAGCLPGRSRNSSQFPGDPHVCINPSFIPGPGIIPRNKRREFSSLIWISVLKPAYWCPFYSSDPCALFQPSSRIY